MDNKIIFSLFADLHYKKGMYIASVADIEQIFERAERDGADFVAHLGDMCNDYLRSSELAKAYLDNRQGLEVYGVYGNHELETVGNTMQVVTPLLTNRPADVIWGTEDKTISDGNIAYYYFDKGVFRFICLDSNYSKNTETQEYEHNLPASWGPPDKNEFPNSLGETQLKWLRETLLDAAEKEKHCVVLSHSSFAGLWQECNDTEIIQQMFKEANAARPKTVVLAINGHLHTNHSAQIDDVVYLDINSVRSGWWASNPFYPYAEEDINAPKYTFEYTEYDQGGRPACSFMRPLSSLTMGAQTLFYADPLSVTVTLHENGSVFVKGSTTTWLYGIGPDSYEPEKLLKISNLEFKK